MRICHTITASSVKLLQLHGKEIPHNTSFCVSLACHYLLYSPTHSSSLNSYLLTYAYTKHQNWTKYPGPIQHLILYRYQETAIQWAFVEFCAANEGRWRMRALYNEQQVQTDINESVNLSDLPKNVGLWQHSKLDSNPDTSLHKANMHVCKSANEWHTVRVNDTITERSCMPDNDKITRGACTQFISSDADQPASCLQQQS